MMYFNIIVIKNYAILHIISIIMRLCMIKHPGTPASTVSTPTTTNERLPAQQKERLPAQQKERLPAQQKERLIVTQQFIEGDWHVAGRGICHL